MNDKQLRSKLIRLAHANPKLRADLLPLLTKQAAVAKKAQDSSLDPRKAMMYFDISFEDYNIDDAAEEGDEIALKLQGGDDRLAVKLEGDAIKAAERILGVKVSNEGHDSAGNLVCKFGVDSWGDVDKAYKAISRNTIGGDDQIDLAPFYVGQGFFLLPQGVNGPKYGNVPGRKGDLDDWLADNKPGKKAAADKDKKVKGKALDKLISQTYYKHGTNVMIDMMSIPKIYKEAETAYNNAASHEEGMKALDVAMKASVAKYKV